MTYVLMGTLNLLSHSLIHYLLGLYVDVMRVSARTLKAQLYIQWPCESGAPALPNVGYQVPISVYTVWHETTEFRVT